MRSRLEQAGLAAEVELDSAGTGDWHIGRSPDVRSIAAAAARGYRMDSVGRQVEAADFSRFDLILAMDRSNLADLRAIAPEQAEHIRLFRDFGDETDHGLDVPDPYYGDGDGFSAVLDIIERCCAGLLDEIRLNRAGGGGGAGHSAALDPHG